MSVTRWLGLAAAMAILTMAGPAAAQTVNVYTAWPESLSQPIFKAYTAKTGVQVNFIRLSTGELVARATDAGSGVDPQSIVARVDGHEREATFRDGTVRVDVGGLRLGRHAVRLQVSDYQETRNTENVARILPNTRVLETTFVVAKRVFVVSRPAR